jgi:hypothetical protein
VIFWRRKRMKLKRSCFRLCGRKADVGYKLSD